MTRGLAWRGGLPRRVAAIARVALLAAAAACMAERRESSSADDVAIYRLVLAPDSGAGILRRVVQRTTQPVPDIIGTARERLPLHAGELPGLEESTVRAFLAREGQVAAIPELGDPTLKWIGRDQWRATVDGAGGWNRLLPRDSGFGGVTLVSRIGYSRDGAQALVHVIQACPQCGKSEYVLLSRATGEWRVVARATDIVS